jgi:hypothetical protein
MYYTPTRFLLHPISPNSIQITLAFPQQRAGNSPSLQELGTFIPKHIFVSITNVGVEHF